MQKHNIIIVNSAVNENNRHKAKQKIYIKK